MFHAVTPECSSDEVTKENFLRVFVVVYKYVLLWFQCLLQILFYVTLTISLYNVLPVVICCNPRRACTARVTVFCIEYVSVCLSVCLSVCPSVRPSVRPTTKERYQKVHHYKCGKFCKSTAFQSYGVKTKWMLISTGLPRPWPIVLCILKTQEVTMTGVYWLQHAIHYCT